MYKFQYWLLIRKSISYGRCKRVCSIFCQDYRGKRRRMLSYVYEFLTTHSAVLKWDFLKGRHRHDSDYWSVNIVTSKGDILIRLLEQTETAPKRNALEREVWVEKVVTFRRRKYFFFRYWNYLFGLSSPVVQVNVANEIFPNQVR